MKVGMFAAGMRQGAYAEPFQHTIFAVQSQVIGHLRSHRLCITFLCCTLAGVQFKAKWHVGDTPMDVQAAQGGHAKALGVLTGVYSRQDLEGCGAGQFGFCVPFTWQVHDTDQNNVSWHEWHGISQAQLGLPSSTVCNAKAHSAVHGLQNLSHWRI